MIKNNLNLFRLFLNHNWYYIIRAPMGFSKNIGKFYYVKYLPKYPDLIIVNFNEEITDTKAILEAGFVKEDIKLHLTDKKNKHE